MCPVRQDGRKKIIVRDLSWLLGESFPVTCSCHGLLGLCRRVLCCTARVMERHHETVSPPKIQDIR